MTFVAIDAGGQPRPVAPIVPETSEEKRRYQDAELRRAARLQLKADLARKQQQA